MIWQRQRRITYVPGSERIEHDQMAAAGIAERAYSARSVELGRVYLEPTNREVHVTDRGRVPGLRRLAEIDSRHQNTPRRQRPVDTSIAGAVAVVPRSTVHADDGWKWSRSFGLVDTRQPGLAREVLILDIPHVNFEFNVIRHGRNL